MDRRPRVAVHKFTSCDGCQLAFLNLGPTLLSVAGRVELAHFVEAGPVNPDAEVDIAFVEGSVSTADERARIQRVRARTRYLITIGACATSGGLQALRNDARDGGAWVGRVYANPGHIDSLGTSTAISDHVRVDFQLWGCPVSGGQILAALGALLHGVTPVPQSDAICQECKRRGNPCVLVTRGEPCLGPVTRTGCGALCPSFGRDCYGCYGPTAAPNTASLGRRYAGLGLAPREVALRFRSIHSTAPALDAAPRLDDGDE